MLCHRLLHHHGLVHGRRLQCRLFGLLLGLGLLRSRLLRCLGRALGRTLGQLLLGHLERAFRCRRVEVEDLKGAELIVTSEDSVVVAPVAAVAGRREALRILLGLGLLAGISGLWSEVSCGGTRDRGAGARGLGGRCGCARARVCTGAGVGTGDRRTCFIVATVSLLLSVSSLKLVLV